MLTRRVIGTVIILTWMTTLAFVAGPVRWEIAHTYEHLTERAGSDLPRLTMAVGRPALGLGPASLVSTVARLVGWGFAWLGPLVLLGGAWRAGSRQVLADWLLYGLSLYLSIMLLLAVIVLVGLWLPFALL